MANFNKLLKESLSKAENLAKNVDLNELTTKSSEILNTATKTIANNAEKTLNSSIEKT